ncbi:MAG: DEAD/DEAH box helicase [Treponemataceae bacterium]|nr:DEAD/DEAH box helicase [Treponemataceae bacterium]
MNFTEFNLSPDLMKGLETAGYEKCTPVQEQVLTCGLSGDDLYVQSQTGTGKTASYLVLMLQQLLTKQELAGKKALIMVPTRELAVQVEEEAKTLISGTNLKTGSFYGGVGYEKQTALLQKNIDILVGTPGRVIDLCESGAMDLSSVAFLVVDEADRMFDMGFYPDLRKLIKILPAMENRQTMLFSATLNTYVKNLAWEYTENAKEVTIEAEHITIDEIDQVLLHVSSDEKTKLLVGILKNENPESVIIFCNTKRSSEVIAKRLKINGIEAEYIIGDLPQSKRLAVLKSFKEGTLKCLVATDVAARGIDVDDLQMVINYDLPSEAENYVHRIGRTARAGKSGKAYTFCSEQDVYNLPAIERYLGYTIPATMAAPEMMVEDASAGMYIKTDRYDADFDNNRGDRRNNRDRGNHHGKGRYEGKGNYKNGENRGNGENRKDSRKSGYNKNGKQSYNRSREKANFEQDLSTLSFEERMKLYKEKYAGGEKTERASYSESSYSTGKSSNHSGSKKSSGKGNNKKYNKKSTPAKHPTAPKGTTLGGGKPRDFDNIPKKGKNQAPAKKGSAGLLGIIQKLFGKKK